MTRDGNLPKNPLTVSGQSQMPMADEHIEDQDTSTEEETEDESEENTEEEGESTGSDSGDESDEEDIDWKKTAQDEREAREKAEKKLAERRFKKTRKKNESGDEGEEGEEDDQDDGTLTRAEVENLIRESNDATRREVVSGRVSEIARDLAESEDEADAIAAIWGNRSFPEGMALEKQVREAFFIAHGPRLMGKIEELRRTNRSSRNTGRSGSENTYHDDKNKKEPKGSAQDKAEMQRLGFTWDGKRYTKQLSNGKTLVKDPKTNKTFVEA